MPSRRRPAEPSPRLLALLAADGASARPGGTPQPGARPSEPPGGQPTEPPGGQPTEPPAGHPLDSFLPDADSTEPWLPRRDWLDGQPAEAPSVQPRAAPPPPGRHRRPRPPGPALLTVPAALKGARLTAPRAAALGMVLVVVLAVAVFGVRVAWARAASAPEPVAPASGGGRASAVVARTGAPSGFGSDKPGGGPAPTGPAATTRAGQVVVHVVGQVRHPGVVVLALGDRVGDALKKAGGALPGADLSALNLARTLVDGEQVRVPKPGEAALPAAQGPDGGAPGVGSGAAGSSAPVNLNTATSAVLEELPGVGPVLAQRIVDWRTEHGRFASVDELAEVSGIGEKMFAQLQGKVTV